MPTIWKFPLDVTDTQEIDMPSGVSILTVMVQGGVPCLWALVDPDKPTMPRTIAIYGTGHEVTADLTVAKYVGSFMLVGGDFVGHVYDLTGITEDDEAA